MASSASAATAPRPAASSASASPNEAILRNALRYTISAREYAALHKYVLSKSKLVRRRAPTVEQVTRIMDGPSSLPPSKASTPRPSTSGGPPKSPSKKDKLPELTDPDTPRAIIGADDFNARAVRHALRVFMASAAGLKLYEAVQRRLFGKPRYVMLNQAYQCHLLLSTNTISDQRKSLFTSLPPCASPSRYPLSSSSTASSSDSSHGYAPTCSIRPPYRSACATHAQRLR